MDAPFLSQVLLTIGDTNRIRGNATLATAAYREAIDLVSSTRSAQVLVPALAGLARTTFLDDPEESREYLARALRQPAALGDVPAVLAAGWMALVDGDHVKAVELGRAAEREAGRRRDLPRLAESLELRALALAMEPDGYRGGSCRTCWSRPPQSGPRPATRSAWPRTGS